MLGLADTIALFHGLLILSVLVGIGLSVKYKRFRPLEALFLLSAVVIWSLYGGCPLTLWEADLRGFDASHPFLVNGFIAYYLEKFTILQMDVSIINAVTYLLAGGFLILAIDWELPFLRKYFRGSKKAGF